MHERTDVVGVDGAGVHVRAQVFGHRGARRVDLLLDLGAGGVAGDEQFVRGQHRRFEIRYGRGEFVRNGRR